MTTPTTAAPASSQGLRNISVADSNTSLVNGKEGKLTYVGYSIEDLAANALFEEVVYLLWNGRLPGKAELEAFRAQIAQNSTLPAEVLKVMQSFPADSNGMAVLAAEAGRDQRAVIAEGVDGPCHRRQIFVRRRAFAGVRPQIRPVAMAGNKP